SNVAIAGIGLPAKTAALKLLKVAGTVSNSVIRVGTTGTVGDVGTVSVGAFDNSRLFAGYTDSGAGSFNLPSTIGLFAVTGKTNAFAHSFVYAANFKNVSLKSVNTDNGGTKFGVVYHTLLKVLSVKTPSFKFNTKGPATQDMPMSDFEVAKG